MNEELRIRRAAAAMNSMKSFSYPDTGVGVKPHALRLQMGNDNYLNAVYEFIIASRYDEKDAETNTSIAAYYSDPAVLLQALAGIESQNANAIVKKAPLSTSLETLLNERRSVRNFTGDPIPVAYLHSLMFAACGITHKGFTKLRSTGERFEVQRRTAPSGGALYPIELLVVYRKVINHSPAVYRYLPRENATVQIGDEHLVEELEGCFNVPEDIISLSRSSAIFILLGHPLRSINKYGARGLRHVFIETGAITQNVHLACNSLGVGSVDCASFVDEKLNEALDLDGLSTIPVHSIIIGMTA